MRAAQAPIVCAAVGLERVTVKGSAAHRHRSYCLRRHRRLLLVVLALHRGDDSTVSRADGSVEAGLGEEGPTQSAKAGHGPFKAWQSHVYCLRAHQAGAIAPHDCEHVCGRSAMRAHLQCRVGATSRSPDFGHGKRHCAPRAMHAVPCGSQLCAHPPRLVRLRGRAHSPTDPAPRVRPKPSST